MSEENERFVSPMLTCPECGSGDIDRQWDEATLQYDISDCYCMFCGEHWKEIEFNPSEWEDD